MLSQRSLEHVLALGRMCAFGLLLRRGSFYLGGICIASASVSLLVQTAALLYHHVRKGDRLSVRVLNYFV